MNHFQGINPDERWRNDLLNELRKLNEHLQAKELVPEPKPVQNVTNKRGHTQ